MWVLMRLGFPPAGVVTMYERGTTVSLSSTSTGYHFIVTFCPGAGSGNGLADLSW